MIKIFNSLWKPKKKKVCYGFSHNVIATIRDEHGNIIDKREGHNTITDGDPNSVENGLVFALTKLFDTNDDFGHYDSTLYVDAIDLGSGTPSDSGLGSSLSVRKVYATADKSLDISTLSAPVVTLSKTWDASDGAISGISEAGLFVNGSPGADSLWAYKTFSPVLNKAASSELTIDWQITATVP